VSQLITTFTLHISIFEKENRIFPQHLPNNPFGPPSFHWISENVNSSETSHQNGEIE